MTLTIHSDVDQGTDAWFELRRGIITASVVGQLISKGSPDPLSVACPRCFSVEGESCISTARKVPTPIKTIHDERTARASTLPPVYRVADTDTARAMRMNLIAERITGQVERVYPNNDMQRGTLSEPYARDIYAEHYAPVEEVAFMVYERAGYRIGYSPDGLVGDDGLIEIKSPRAKTHLATLLADEVPSYNMAQCQAGLLVSGRKWLDFISYHGGMPLFVKRVYPNPAWFNAITSAVEIFEGEAERMIANYAAAIEGRPATERIDFDMEMSL